ncbi:MAG: hypothetical protein GY807_22640 [Gammaproteobacteria bacterium]|nr:hypothetical protein [Gammaproteobacteria bacterium]
MGIYTFIRISANMLSSVVFEARELLGQFTMTTQKQIDANRLNANKSTGPKTEAGKAKSARNATKHGALSRVSVAEHEDKALFEALLGQLEIEHDPRTTIEGQLVERLALLLWREIRLAKAEAFQSQANKLNIDFENEMSKSAGGFVRNRLPRYYQAIEGVLPIETQLLIGRYQTMLSNQIAQTLSQLRKEQDLRADMIEVESTDN